MTEERGVSARALYMPKQGHFAQIEYMDNSGDKVSLVWAKRAQRHSLQAGERTQTAALSVVLLGLVPSIQPRSGVTGPSIG